MAPHDSQLASTFPGKGLHNPVGIRVNSGISYQPPRGASIEYPADRNDNPLGVRSSPVQPQPRSADACCFRPMSTTVAAQNVTLQTRAILRHNRLEICNIVCHLVGKRGVDSRERPKPIFRYRRPWPGPHGSSRSPIVGRHSSKLEHGWKPWNV